ncbi:hypothetical protein [Sphingomonas sp. 67-41]|nr:hypothetical protein [Sphingomonas sp. 67-41]MBN8811826.1 hypothetical protein [Sphingomonas sp.]
MPEGVRRCSAVAFVDFWLDEFRKTRDKNQTMVDAFSRRVADEFGVDIASQPAAPEEGQGWLAGAGKITVSRILCQLLLQGRSLARLLGGIEPGKRNVLIVADTRRLDLSGGGARLHESLAPISASEDYDWFADRIAAAQRRLIFTPNLFVEDAPTTRELARIGYLGIAALPFLAPLTVLRHVARLFRRTGGGLNRGNLRWCLMAALVDALFEKGRIGECILLTSNSFVVELVRWRSVMREGAGDTVEVMHGVPTRELLDYYAAMAAFAERNGAAGRMRFAPTVPAVMVNWTSLNEPLDFAINTKLRDFTTRTSEEAVRGQVSPAVGRKYRVAINGGASEPTPYFETHLFKIEWALVEAIRRFAGAHDVEIEIGYSIHPAHAKSGLAAEFPGKLAVDTLLDQSIYTWLGYDLCVSLLSSSIWDARYLGTPTFIAVAERDGLYSAELLAGGDYVSANVTTLEALETSLSHMVERDPVGNEEISRRIARLYGRDARQSDQMPEAAGMGEAAMEGPQH